MHASRTNSTQLPSSRELLTILENESQRKAVRFDFVQKNISLFDVHHQLSKVVGSDDSWINTYETLSLELLDQKLRKNHEELSTYIKQHRDGHIDLYTALFLALIPEEKKITTDGIFVFGAETNARIERAVELYNEGIAPKIIISGNSPYYVDDVRAEANRMAVFALEQGIPSGALILEDTSITLPDNVKRSIDLFESLHWKPSSLTIVASNFVLTRAAMEWYKFSPWDIHISSVAAHPQSDRFTPEGWTNDDDTIVLVLNEYAKIIFESKIDKLRSKGEIA